MHQSKVTNLQCDLLLILALDICSKKLGIKACILHCLGKLFCLDAGGVIINLQRKEVSILHQVAAYTS